MPDLTDLDLGRLLVFVTLHEGHLPDLPQRVVETYRRLESAGLVTVEETEDTGYAVYLSAIITPRGREVAAAMLGAGRSAMNSAI